MLRHLCIYTALASVCVFAAACGPSSSTSGPDSTDVLSDTWTDTDTDPDPDTDTDTDTSPTDTTTPPVDVPDDVPYPSDVVWPGGPIADGFDAGPFPADASTEVTSAPVVVWEGTGEGLLLRGVVLAPQGVLDRGDVLIQGNLITCVAPDCTHEPGATAAVWVDTMGTISPGLVDGHNHMAYNFIPEWEPGMTFTNRYVWADDPSYEEHILPYTAHRSSNTHFCPGAKWAELRSLIHGTTTMQGQPSASGSCIDWAVRNANRYHGLGYDHMRGTISSPRDITDDDAQNYVDSFVSAADPITRFHVHMCEGVSGNNVEEEFASFAGRDTRDNRHAGLSLLDYGTAVLIHSMILTPAELDEAANTGSMIVWSPSSNFALYGYGVTAPIAEILDRGIPTGIGPDWTLSGEDEMLGELRVALAYGQDQGIAALTPKKLWEMATSEGALVLGLDDGIGRLEVGMRADVAVFGRTSANPFLGVIESRAEDVRLVSIDGEVFFGDEELALVARNPYCDTIDACGLSKFICVQDSPTADKGRDETLGDIETQLYNILEGVGYPPEEQYGRGDELLGLVQCGI